MLIPSPPNVSATEASNTLEAFTTLPINLPFLPRQRRDSDVVSNTFLMKIIPVNKRKTDGSKATSAGVETAPLSASLSTQSADGNI